MARDDISLNRKRFPQLVADKPHGRENGLLRFIRCQKLQALLRGSFDVDAHPVRQHPKLLEKLGIGARDRLAWIYPANGIPHAEGEGPRSSAHKYNQDFSEPRNSKTIPQCNCGGKTGWSALQAPWG